MACHALLQLCILLAFLVTESTANYVLLDNYLPSNFFSMFSFFNGSDPTHGFVQYVDQSTAQSSGLISTNSSSVYIGVDHDNMAPNGRASVRLTSTKSYNHGLFIADIAHMPGGVCGVWPAFWTVGPNWPNDGEIDIIEQVNQADTNLISLHTGDNCTMTNAPQTGSFVDGDCNAYANNNQGCGTSDPDPQSFGAGFNQAGGGVYAMQWDSVHIRVWFWPRSSIPSDALTTSPSPVGWGTPVADFRGSCDIDQNFQSHQIVFDTTFCGDWAGNAWGSSSCAGIDSSSSCNDFVQNNPAAFDDAYWEINSLRVFQMDVNPGMFANTTNSTLS